jgi:hypothetical protein
MKVERSWNLTTSSTAPRKESSYHPLMSSRLLTLQEWRKQTPPKFFSAKRPNCLLAIANSGLVPWERVVTDGQAAESSGRAITWSHQCLIYGLEYYSLGQMSM